MSESQEQQVTESRVISPVTLEADTVEKVTEELKQLVLYTPFESFV